MTNIWSNSSPKMKQIFQPPFSLILTAFSSLNFSLDGPL